MRTLALIEPDWPAPRQVRAVVTTRRGGVSSGPYSSLNLAQHTGDDRACVAENRRRVQATLGLEAVRWLDQQHGTRVVDANAAAVTPPPADAVFCRGQGPACAIMSADCLPVLICDRSGGTVAAAHCGWRGLASGVLDAVLARLAVAPGELLAWLGPAIGPQRYEVGEDVRDALGARLGRRWQSVARPTSPGKWLLDLYGVARAQLEELGVPGVHGGGWCTFDDERFYSYRRDGVTGRMVSLVWIASD